MSKVIFDDNTDYQDVYSIDKRMFSDIQANRNCCGNLEATALCKSSAYLKAADLADISGETQKFNDAVKISYLTLYPFQKYDYNI